MACFIGNRRLLDCCYVIVFKSSSLSIFQSPTSDILSVMSILFTKSLKSSMVSPNRLTSVSGCKASLSEQSSPRAEREIFACIEDN